MERTVTYSAFVIVPEDNQKERFVWVIDLPDAREKTPKKKFPGGGVQTGETPEMAAGKEVSEEVGLRIVDPSENQRLTEIHKRSAFNGNIPHKDIFFESGCPLEGTALEAGKEISETSWNSRKEILKKIENGEFYPNHAAAFLWLMIRDTYLSTPENKLLSPILNSRRHSSWSVKKGVLIICYNQTCKECARTITTIPTASSPVTPYRAEHKIHTALKYVFIDSDKFTYENSIFLASAGARWTYRLPSEQFPHYAAVMEKLNLLKRNNEFIYSFPLFEALVVLCNYSSTHTAQEWKKISLNKNPDFFMHAEEWQTVLHAINTYNTLPDRKKIHPHYGWLYWNTKNKLV